MNKNEPTPIKKRPGVRRLISASDARKLQARLIKQFLVGDIDEALFKATTYGISQFLNCLKTEADLEPEAGYPMVTEIVMVVGDELGKQIDEMNSNILEAPEDE